MGSGSDILHPVTISQVMLNFAASHGVDSDSCLLGTGIDTATLHESEALITRDQEMRLIENLMLSLPGVSALGLKVGFRYSVSTFGVLGFAIRTSRSLHEALKHCLRYLPLSTAYCRIDLLESGNTLSLVFDPSDIPQRLRQFLLERDMATAINLVHELSLSGVAIQRIQMQGPELPYAEEMEELCGVTPQFQCDRSALVFPRDEANWTLPTYDAHLFRMLEDQCRHQLERRQQTGLTGQVRALLLGRLGLVSGIEEVAASLSISTRSLRRKLEAEGNSYRQIVEAERRQLAEQFLCSSQVTLDEMAIHLGYSDTASFTRAFRRWFGMSPGAYRDQHLSRIADPS
ncbi:MAG: AraC family transcriptional regulator [Salinisphaeraceae bacterium]|nr:AraC family transcriptional regulator [Salinisphaeraceae bacterium]